MKRLGQFRVLGLPSQWSISIGLLRGLRSFYFLGSLRATGSGPISPSVRRPCTAGPDRASPSSSYSDPLSVCERWCWCDRIGVVLYFLLVEVSS
ncbi:hypothetical protein ACOSQ3_019492 [Xanthoceras sorbifolium]